MWNLYISRYTKVLISYSSNCWYWCVSQMFTIRWFVFPHEGGFWSLTLQPVGAELCHRCSQSGDICVQTADEGLYHRSAQSCDICMFPGAGRCWSLTLQTANEGLYHSHVISVCFQVQEGLDLLLYNLLVLGCITDIHGHVWRRSSSDLYLIEAMPLLEHTESQVIYFAWPLFWLGIKPNY